MSPHDTCVPQGYGIYGGAICTTISAHLTVTNSTFDRNKARTKGTGT